LCVCVCVCVCVWGGVQCQVAWAQNVHVVRSVDINKLDLLPTPSVPAETSLFCTEQLLELCKKRERKKGRTQDGGKRAGDADSTTMGKPSGAPGLTSSPWTSTVSYCASCPASPTAAGPQASVVCSTGALPACEAGGGDGEGGEGGIAAEDECVRTATMVSSRLLK